jgi:hypothetical protein
MGNRGNRGIHHDPKKSTSYELHIGQVGQADTTEEKKTMLYSQKRSKDTTVLPQIAQKWPKVPVK